MHILPVRLMNVQIHTSLVGQGLKEVLEKKYIKVAYFLLLIFDPINKIRSPSEVDCHLAQRFVHGQKDMAVTRDALAVTQCLIESLTKNQTHILDRVVIIDVQVAFGFYIQVKQTVFCQQLQHVIKKGYPRANRGLAGPVNVQGQGNLGFPGFSFDTGRSFFHPANLATLPNPSMVKLQEPQDSSDRLVDATLIERYSARLLSLFRN